jgi:hypothetical protein
MVKPVIQPIEISQIYKNSYRKHYRFISYLTWSSYTKKFTDLIKLFGDSDDTPNQIILYFINILKLIF